jgi:hypothetical protein
MERESSVYFQDLAGGRDMTVEISVASATDMQMRIRPINKVTAGRMLHGEQTSD